MRVSSEVHVDERLMRTFDFSRPALTTGADSLWHLPKIGHLNEVDLLRVYSSQYVLMFKSTIEW